MIPAVHMPNEAINEEKTDVAYRDIYILHFTSHGYV